jgi:hypothetical protein
MKIEDYPRKSALVRGDLTIISDSQDFNATKTISLGDIVTSLVPTTLSSFSTDSTHRLVSDAEKVVWNAKQNSIVRPVSGPSTAVAGHMAVFGADSQTLEDGGVPGTGGGGGYTNLTSFVSQTAWRVFYSDGYGDVKELALGANGTYLRSNGLTSVPSFSTPTGAGDIVGPGSATDGAVALFDGVTGKILKNGVVLGTASTKTVGNVVGQIPIYQDGYCDLAHSQYQTQATCVAGGGTWTSSSSPLLPVSEPNAVEYDNGTHTTSATISAVNGASQKLTLTNGQTCALTFVQPDAGTMEIKLKVVQSTSGSFNGLISGGKWSGGSVPAITATTGAIDIVTCYLDGTNTYCSIKQDYR